jgi:hypothetical protein
MLIDIDRARSLILGKQACGLGVTLTSSHIRVARLNTYWAPFCAVTLTRGSSTWVITNGPVVLGAG